MTLAESAGKLNARPIKPNNRPLKATAKATANTALCPKNRIAARYRPKRTNMGRLTETTARYAGQSEGVNAGNPALRLSAAQRAMGIMIASMHVEITRLVGR